MSTLNLNKKTPVRSGFWKNIAALLCLDAAVVISWIAYHKYQPALLEQFHFQDFSPTLVVLQAVILFIMPPVSGYAADRLRKSGGSRLPIITGGISLAAMVFMTVSFTVSLNPGGALRLALPFMIGLWLISMNIFHGPAISVTELFVPTEQLPRLAALLAVVTESCRALEPSIINLINYLGAPVTFAGGGIAVFAAGFFLRNRLQKLPSTAEQNPKNESQESDFKVVALVGLLMGTAVTLFFNWMPSRAAFLPETGIPAEYQISVLIALAALVSYPIALRAEKIGALKAFKIAVVFCFLAGFLIFTPLAEYAGLFGFLLWIPAFALLTVTALPVVFSKLSLAHKVTGTGLFFAFSELPNGLTEMYQAGILF